MGSLGPAGMVYSGTMVCEKVKNSLMNLMRTRMRRFDSCVMRPLEDQALCSIELIVNTSIRKDSQLNGSSVLNPFRGIDARIRTF